MSGRVTELPSGTLTFLLTDIERSTALWERFGEEMARAVERHEQIIQGATEDSGGILVRSKGEGDSCFCVFEAASAGVAAALRAQLDLAAEPWPGPRIAVRMALHTGASELREGQYYGTVVNRCARLRGVAHGGQTLLSATTAELVRSALAADANLKDLGAHRLPDLAQPERVYQLGHPSLPSDFPALASVDAYPNNLPVQLTRFVGRETELADLSELTRAHRLVTITGPGGCGKTRLALQFAADSLATFPDGVWLVNLAPVSDGELVVAELAATLGLREEANRNLVEVLVDHLEDKRLLLVLDNCEHVLAAAATLAEHLLQGCADVCIVATSREGLGIDGEVARQLEALTVPPSDDMAAEDIFAYEGTQLLADRAAMVRSGFEVTSGNAHAVAHICRRLDGIPLAIELAAARLGALGANELARRLDDRFRLLGGGRRGGPARHQTLDAAVDWSYELCDDAERLLFRRLAVFAGRFTLEAVENICVFDGLGANDAAALLSRLVDRSLVHADTEDETITYRMLQTIRSFALARLEDSGEDVALRSRHVDWFLDLAEHADLHLLGTDRERWVSVLDAQQDDIRAALEWSLVSDAPRGLRLATSLGNFWDRRGHWTEGRRWLKAAIAVAPADDPHLIRALSRAGNLSFQQGDYDEGRRLLAQSLALSREANDDLEAAITLSRSAELELEAGDVVAGRKAFEEALEINGRLGDERPAGLVINLALAAQALLHPRVEQLYAEALRLSRLQGNTGGVAGALVGLGTLAQARGDLDEATAMHDEALGLFRQFNDRFGIATTLTSLSSIVRAAGDRERSAALLDEALPIQRGLGDRRGTSRSLVRLGLHALDRGDLDAARERLREALGIYRDLNDAPGIASALTYLARTHVRGGDGAATTALLIEANEWCRRNPIHRTTATYLEEVAAFVRQQDPAKATELLGAADSIRRAAGAREPRSDTAHDDTVSDLRSVLGAERFDEAWDAGADTEAEIAFGLALTALGR